MAQKVGSGAVDAVLIAASDIEIDAGLAKICHDPGCHNYGASPGCPPHVAGPAAFEAWLKDYDQALFIKIDVPMESLLSHEYRDIMRLLHEMVADIEEAAVKAGYPRARGFAGGSCKELFCSAYTDCNVLERKSDCRNPGCSRPSMSGFGIDVSKLKDLAGWGSSNHAMLNNSTAPTGNSEADNNDTGIMEMEMGAVYGLILIN